MDPQDNIRVVKQTYDNFKTGNIPAVLSLVADKVEWQVPDIEGVPLSGKRKGREEVADFFRELAEEEDVISFEPQDFIAQGDKVVAFGNIFLPRESDAARVYQRLCPCVYDPEREDRALSGIHGHRSGGYRLSAKGCGLGRSSYLIHKIHWVYRRARLPLFSLANARASSFFRAAGKSSNADITSAQ